MILLDTNVVSETARLEGDKACLIWLAAQPADSLFLCAPVLGELWFGAMILPEGRRRQILAAALERIETQVFAGRVLPFDAEAARLFAAYSARRRAAGRPISAMDAMIAAIAGANGMTLATRNVADFSGLDLPIVNPFEPG